jgi:hypothetical protein
MFSVPAYSAEGGERNEALGVDEALLGRERS